MEGWREKALVILPQLSGELADEREVFSPYAVWFKLLPRVRQAHRDGDDKLLARIYALAEWCRSQPEQEIWNSVCVSFYEHLFDEPWMRPLVPRWLSDRAVADAWPLWELGSPVNPRPRALRRPHRPRHAAHAPYAIDLTDLFRDLDPAVLGDLLGDDRQREDRGQVGRSQRLHSRRVQVGRGRFGKVRQDVVLRSATVASTTAAAS